MWREKKSPLSKLTRRRLASAGSCEGQRTRRLSVSFDSSQTFPYCCCSMDLQAFCLVPPS